MRLTCEPRDLGGSGKLPKDDPVDRRVGLACAFAQKETPADSRSWVNETTVGPRRRGGVAGRLLGCFAGESGVSEKEER